MASGRRGWWSRAFRLASLTAAVLGCLAGPVSAAPGPARDVPDLALIVSGDTGRTVTLHADDPDFARLRRLLQPTYTGTERVPRAWADGRYPAVRLTVLWGLTGVGGWPQTHRAPGGDVAMERQDQLFLDADGAPWVRTDVSPDVVDDDIRWHRASPAVYRQLDLTGLFGPGPEAAGGAEAASGSVAGPTGSERGSDGGGEVMDGVRWAVPGLLVGAAGGFLMCRAAARWDAGPPREEPRQELIG